MNDRRDELLRIAITKLHCRMLEEMAKSDWGMVAMYTADMSDMCEILHQLKKNNIESILEACRRYVGLDTAARDEYPQFVAQLAGATLNWPDPSESMEGTE